jgi:hypothetical protein
MQRLWLTGQVLPAGACLFVQHVFQSDEERALEVIYSFPLPRAGALRRFRITGDGFETHSEFRETAEAVKAYEEGIAGGSLSVLARQYGDGIVNLTVGNIRPKEKVTIHLEVLAGVELRDGGFRFRFPFTLAPVYHSKILAAVPNWLRVSGRLRKCSAARRYRDHHRRPGVRGGNDPCASARRRHPPVLSRHRQRQPGSFSLSLCWPARREESAGS